MPDADTARLRLVADLVREGRVRSERVRDALASVPRHPFLPDLPAADAYADEAVVIKVEDGVTLSSVSQPSMVAIMLEQLAAEPGDRVLEIGAGAGWNAALLARIVGPSGAVTTVDIDDDLVRGARAHLDAAGVRGVRAVTADGSRGHPDGAPYQRIELTVGTADIRPEWVAQLVPGGRLVLPLTVRGSQLSIAFVRAGPGRLTSISVRACAFVRLRGAAADDVPGPLRLATPGWSAQVSERDGPTAELLDRALARPSRTARDFPAPGAAVDAWDGVGLWCAVADPSVFRLLANGPATETEVGRSLAATPVGRVGIGLAGDDGFALLASDPTVIRGFGDGGAAAAARLAGLVERWVAAGRPHAADLRVEAEVGPEKPGGVSPGGPGGTDGPPGAGEGGPGVDAVVDVAHARLRIRIP